MIFRDAHPGDAPDIVQFQINMARETEDLALDRETCTRGVNAVFDDPSKGRYFVAELDGTVIGSLLITYEWSDWRASMVWWIQSVYVREEHRGTGVYRGLYLHIRQLVEGDPSIAGIRLYVEKRNTRAQAVYSKLGMKGDHYLVFEAMKEF
jgi:GNAT superfamily N-acetyltransferase